MGWWIYLVFGIENRRFKDSDRYGFWIEVFKNWKVKGLMDVKR